MKIEIDINDILGDESGAETLQESVRRQVIDSVAETIKKGIGERIDHAISVMITDSLNKYLKSEMPKLSRSLMDAEFKPVSRWGETDKPTSFRKELLKSITENMTYKKTNYSSDRNAFTKAVDEVVEENVKLFKVDFAKHVDAQFTAAAMQCAADTLKKKLGIS
jgi:hypothetical protein